MTAACGRAHGWRAVGIRGESGTLSRMSTRLPSRPCGLAACLFATLLVSTTPALATRPDDARPPEVAAALARAGSNAAEIGRALAEAPEAQRASMEWLVAHMPAADLATLDAAFLLAHLDGAWNAWRSAPWRDAVDEALFRDAILPYASVSEKRELWLPALRELALPMIGGATTPAQAATMLNNALFAKTGVKYSTKRRRADQAPSESMESGLASCSGLSILLVDACRAVGVPARFVGVPMWTDGSGNHSWVEVWDGARWRYTGAAEPTGDRLDEGWFSGRAAGQNREKPEHAIYAVTWRDTGVEFPMVFDPSRPRARAVDVTDRYTAKPVEIPEGHRLMRVVVRERADGPRIAGTVRVFDESGALLGEGRSRDERRDTNDHLELVVPDGPIRFEFDGVDTAPIELKGTTEGFEVVLSAPRASRMVGSSTDAGSADPKPVAALRAFLKKGSVAEAADAGFAKAPLSKADAARALRILANAVEDETKARDKAAFDARVLELEDGTKMPFWYAVYGDKPKTGRSLWISMHGGGGAPKQVNDGQWENQKKLYRPEEGVYVAPRAPSDTWNLWHQGHIDPLFTKLVRDMIAFEGVDPDRVYLMGYSAGGDGVYQLAPRMADRFAAAAMMAGHPNETKPDGLRNLPFALYMGGKDAAYRRNEIAREWKVALADLAAKDAGGYPHEVTIHEENGHWMDRKDAVAVPWMAKYTRNLRPRKVVWLQDDVTHGRFYWLANPDPKAGQRVVASIDGQTVTIAEAPGVARLEVLLDDALVDLDKPVRIEFGGRTLFEGVVPRTIGAIAATLADRGDPKAAFTASVEVALTDG